MWPMLVHNERRRRRRVGATENSSEQNNDPGPKLVSCVPVCDVRTTTLSADGERYTKSDRKEEKKIDY
jgi:hypothetical protein